MILTPSRNISAFASFIPKGVMRELGNAFVQRGPQPTVPEMMRTYRRVVSELDAILTNAGTNGLFEARAFKDFCFAA